MTTKVRYFKKTARLVASATGNLAGCSCLNLTPPIQGAACEPSAHPCAQAVGCSLTSVQERGCHLLLCSLPDALCSVFWYV